MLTQPIVRRVDVTETDQTGTERPSTGYRPTRRALLPLVGATVALAALTPALASADRGDDDDHDRDERGGGGPRPRAASRYVYVGTYTAPNTAPGGLAPSTAEGIYVFKMDGSNGRLTRVEVVRGIQNPSWVTVDRGAAHLYATSEVATWRGMPNSGGATAYRIDPATGRLTVQNDQPTMGAIPAHSAIDPSGKDLLIANYIGANFSVLPILANGSLGPATDVYPVTGKGPNTARQEAPHPHQVVFDPTGRYVFGPDLGTDKVWSWTLDTTAGKLVANTNLPYGQVASGSGPRHMSFHPSGRFVYVIGEMVSSITAFKYDAAAGTMIWLQTVSTLPPDFTGTSSTAHIQVHPSGKFVYGSNRGHDSIVGFTIDQTTGKLTLIGWASTRVLGASSAVPRNFNIDPSGALLLAANQNGDSIVPFRINQRSGALTQTGAITRTPTPVCIAWGATLGGG
jgi:6-phosphogluconolactonase